MTDDRWVEKTFEGALIPDTAEASGLQVRMVHHDIPYYQPIPCWSYITSGLAAHGQQEVVLTIQSDPQEDQGAPLRFPMEILKHCDRVYLMNGGVVHRELEAGAQFDDHTLRQLFFGVELG